jgi:uncharacterized protein YndB with AHSA1/START domain
MKTALLPLVLALWLPAANASADIAPEPPPKKENPLPIPPPPVADIDADLFVAEGMVAPIIVEEAVVAAPVADVYAAWTTPEGIQGFFEVDAAVGLRIGGPMEFYFIAEAEPGGKGSEGCQILSYVPNEMLSFSWSAPPQFPDERPQRTWVVIDFTDNGDGTTGVRLRHLGFGEGGNWTEIHAYFDSAWRRVMDALIARFASP